VSREQRDGDERQRSLAEARANRIRLTLDGPAPTPSFLGVRTLEDYPLEDLVPRIDWTPFFQTWELKGHYPEILRDPAVGPAATELLRDAERLLDRMVRERLIQARAVLGFFPANSVGDDIEVYSGTEDRASGIGVIHTLRQQMAKSSGRPNLALADFVAPKESGVVDFVGGFAVTAGIGLDPLVACFEQAHDDYQSILAKALADRLAEAFAERLHERVRRELWGYAAGESLTNQQLIQEEYQGIRPAPGYPACPDHTEKRLLFELLQAERNAGIRLTESYAMLPAASVSGYYFWRPESQYFGLGRIGRDQVEDYAARKGMPVEEVERWLATNLAYERAR